MDRPDDPQLQQKMNRMIRENAEHDRQQIERERVSDVTVSEGSEGDGVDPSHYTLFDGKRETLELIEDRLGDQFPGFLEGNAIKYLMRWRRKNGVEDLKKARRYLDWLIEVEDG